MKVLFRMGLSLVSRDGKYLKESYLLDYTKIFDMNHIPNEGDVVTIGHCNYIIQCRGWNAEKPNNVMIICEEEPVKTQKDFNKLIEDLKRHGWTSNLNHDFLDKLPRKGKKC